MVNDFNTSLLLKKSHLLWKYTNSDGETFSNDKQECKSQIHVRVAVVESVTIESKASQNVLFEISAASVGKLCIIGVEYSVKALFLDKEPTDHDIRGKQYFQV